jgi:transposase
VLSAPLQGAWPAVGRLNPRDSAKLAGVAPLNEARGERAGARPIRGGRAASRAVWSMATLTASRCHPGIQAFSQRLLARGKAQTVAITAALRQLLTSLNAMVNTHTLGHARRNKGPVPAHAR